MELDENLAKLMKQLGAAINSSLAGSDAVSEALSEIREAGYDVFLVLEATIGFQKRKGAETEEVPARDLPSGELVLSAQDAQCLKSLKIRLGGTGENS